MFPGVPLVVSGRYRGSAAGSCVAFCLRIVGSTARDQSVRAVLPGSRIQLVVVRRRIVRGEMSLIGPRPTLRYQVDQYDEEQLHRLDVKPGITGWAQIHGRAELPWAERIELDLWYVRHHDWKTDLLILLRTPLALVGGTYKGETGGWTRSQ